MKKLLILTTIFIVGCAPSSTPTTNLPSTSEPTTVVTPTVEEKLFISEVYASYSHTFGKAIEITEVTIPTVGEDGLEAEQLQADMLRILYTIWFSTPLMDSITYWNLADYTAVTFPKWDENNCRGGIFHPDMTPKLAALELYRLIHEEWHTELELTTDAEGYVNFRGFYGKYEAQVEDRCISFGIHK